MIYKFPQELRAVIVSAERVQFADCTHTHTQEERRDTGSHHHQIWHYPKEKQNELIKNVNPF